VVGVVLLLEAGDDLAYVVGVGDLGGDLHLPGLACLLQRGLVPLQPGHVLEALEQRDSCLRVVELGHVVGDVRDEAHGVVAPLPQPELDERLRAGRDTDLPAPDVLLHQQPALRRVVGQLHRSGVRDGHRHRSHRDDQPHLEVLDDRAHGTCVGLPTTVWLGAGQQEVRRALLVLHQPDHQTRRLVVGVVVLHEGQRRTTRAVVVELVDVEDRHDAALVARRQVLGRQRGRVPGVQETLERSHQHRTVAATPELGDLIDDVHEPGLGHVVSLRSLG
jgi:hypothetical protein